MKFILGYVVVLGCVLGGYMMHGGFLSALWQPSEFVIIGGAAAGAFIVANPIHNMRAVGRSMPLILKGDRFNTDDYLELLGMLYMVFDKIRRSGCLPLRMTLKIQNKAAFFRCFPKSNKIIT